MIRSVDNIKTLVTTLLNSTLTPLTQGKLAYYHRYANYEAIELSLKPGWGEDLKALVKYILGSAILNLKYTSNLNR